jgi:hypothetical protein
VLGHSGGDPGMRQLKEQGTTSEQKNDGFSVDPPSHRGWTENALDRSRSARPDQIKSSLQVAFGNQMRILERMGLRCSLSQFSSKALQTTGTKAENPVFIGRYHF